MNYKEMSAEQLRKEYARLSASYDEYAKMKLSLNMTRGVPSLEQLDLSLGLAGVLQKTEDCFTEDGVDCRTYSAPLFNGVPELRRMFSELFNVPCDYITIDGNSSLRIIYDTISRLCLFGAPGGKPWFGRKIKFICPVPGYDRHFKILDDFGIEAIPVELGPDGPDMDEVEAYAADPDVHGFLSVPKYSNPTGIVFSREVMRRLASMHCAADDFRAFIDDAYGIHWIYEDIPLADVFELGKQYGTEERFLFFASTSKLAFPGAGVSFIAAAPENSAWIRSHMKIQSIGSDKLNQLRITKYFKTADNVRAHMRKQAEILKRHFDVVYEVLGRDLGGIDIADWGQPKGGYFFSLNVPDGCAKRVCSLMSKAGIKMTEPGATYPKGIDPRDHNIRISPSYPETDDLRLAMEILCVCVKLAAIEKLLAA